MKSKQIYGIIIALFIIATSFFISRLPLNFEKLSDFGYLGIFLATLLGTAGIFFPAPNLVFIFAGGRLWNPLLVGLSGGLGSSLGEIGGYFAGRSGVIGMENEDKEGGEKYKKKYKRTQQWIKKYRWLAIFVLAAIPNPVFDATGIVAGFFKLSLVEFLFPVLAGRTLRSVIFAYLGYASKLI